MYFESYSTCQLVKEKKEKQYTKTNWTKVRSLIWYLLKSDQFNTVNPNGTRYGKIWTDSSYCFLDTGCGKGANNEKSMSTR